MNMTQTTAAGFAALAEAYQHRAQVATLVAWHYRAKARQQRTPSAASQYRQRRASANALKGASRVFASKADYLYRLGEK